jgi:hypothetical protein
VNILGTQSLDNFGDRGWFVTAAYRVAKRLEVGTYNSRYYVDAPTISAPAANHVFDQAVTARVDVTKWLNLKVEGHFMDGNGDPFSTHGFYSRDNPGGLKPATNMLVIRLGYSM